jgi:hypothetical protein
VQLRQSAERHTGFIGQVSQALRRAAASGKPSLMALRRSPTSPAPSAVRVGSRRALLPPHASLLSGFFAGSSKTAQREAAKEQLLVRLEGLDRGAAASPGALPPVRLQQPDCPPEHMSR